MRTQKIQCAQILIHGISKVVLTGNFGFFPYRFCRERQACNLILAAEKQKARELNCPITGIGDTKYRYRHWCT